MAGTPQPGLPILGRVTMKASPLGLLQAFESGFPGCKGMRKPADFSSNF